MSAFGAQKRARHQAARGLEAPLAAGYAVGTSIGEAAQVACCLKQAIQVPADRLGHAGQRGIAVRRGVSTDLVACSGKLRHQHQPGRGELRAITPQRRDLLTAA